MQFTFSGYRHGGGSPEGSMTEPLSQDELQGIIVVLAEKIEGILPGYVTCAVDGGQLVVEPTGDNLSERMVGVVNQAVIDFARKRNLKY